MIKLKNVPNELEINFDFYMRDSKFKTNNAFENPDPEAEKVHIG